MSVLIKGIEMPTSCESCPCKTSDAFGGLGCQATGYIPLRKANQDRPDFCPLVEIPPHGRLKEEEWLKKIISRAIEINASIEPRSEAVEQERRCLWWFEQQIGIAPTIIEAEEGE